MIELTDITKKFRRKVVLDGLDLSVGSGQNMMIFGRNGCGKTTLLKIIVGQIQKYGGEVRYEDSLRISSLIETPRFFEYWTGADNLFYFLSESELKNTDKYIDLFEMRDDIERKVHSYSLGMKQKLLLILALSRDFDLLILDEPYISLDESSVHKLDGAIADAVAMKKSVITVSHTINSTVTARTFYFLKDGRLRPVMNKLSGMVKYEFEFINAEKKQQAMSCFAEVNVIGQTANTVTCLVRQDELADYIKKLTEYFVIQARALPLTEDEIYAKGGTL